VPYEQNPEIIAWFETSLGDPRPVARRRAIELLEYVDCAQRERWLSQAEQDEDPKVVSTAVLVRAILARSFDESRLELLESDFYDGCESEDLEWEWEYAVKVCHGCFVPASAVLVWTREEDDEAARRIALLKMTGGQEPDGDEMAIVIGKRVVNRYTRSARTQAEAMIWHQKGRPRYRE
jgi:hypothetical protein